MLKLIKNETPIGVINWTNKEYKTSKIIGRVQSIVVDGVAVSAFTYDGIQFNLSVAPTVSVTINYFYRDVAPVRGMGDVNVWDVVLGFYRKIGRVNEDGSVPQNINKLYPKDYVISEVRKSMKRVLNKSPETNRLQQYTIVTTNGNRVTGTNSNNTITLEQSLENDIIGMFLIEWGTTYEYYSINAWEYQVKDVDITKVGDRVVFGQKVPYGVQKISSVYVNWVEYDYIDERNYTMYGNRWTTITDAQGNRYIFLPYMDDEIKVVVKYVPDTNSLLHEEDIIDIPEEYTDVLIYDVAYRLLQEKEDERWQIFKWELWDGRRQWMLFEFQMFIRSHNKKIRNKIGFAKT